MISMLIGILLYSCSESIKEETVVNLNSINKITSINDSTYFGRINDLIVQRDVLYALDRKNSVINIIDIKDSSNNFVFGTQGKGPGELNKPSRILVNDSALFVINDDSRLNIYDYNLEFKNTFRCKYVFVREFAVDDNGFLYGSTILDYNMISYPIKKVFNGKIYDEFGEILEGEQFQDPLTSNIRSVFNYKNKTLISASVVYPIVELIDLMNGDIKRVDLDNIGLFDKYFDLLSEQSSKEFMKLRTFDLFEDIYLFENKLYFLTYEIIDSESLVIRESNKVVEFELIGKSLHYNKTYVLLSNEEPNRFRSIAVDNNYLFAYNSTSSSINIFRFE